MNSIFSNYKDADLLRLQHDLHKKEIIFFF